MRKIFSLLLIAVFSFGSLTGERKYTEEQDRIKERCVDEVLNIFVQEMEREYQLSCYAIGGSMPYDVKEVGFRFSADRKISIEEARELQVRSTERLVEMINESEKIRPYLIEYPWPSSRVAIAVSSSKDDGSCYEGGVSFIFQAREKLFYYGKQDEHSLGPKILEETYVEAKKIVDSNPSCLKPIEKKKKSFLSWLGF